MNPFEKNSPKISDLSEKSLISRIVKNFGSAMPPYPYGAGDDCALIKKSGLAENIYATSDAVIYGVHFDSNCSARKAGAKLLKRNVSDIAAMGALPKCALTSGVLSKNLSLEYLDEFCLGVAEAAKKYNVKLIGGDIAALDMDYFSMHITLIGDSFQEPLLRRGAAIGDSIYVTGLLGYSFESCHHLDFEPMLKEGRILAQDFNVKACLDISDGLASDLLNIAPEVSSALIQENLLPRRIFNGKPASTERALCDGEDYGLCFAYRGDACGLFENFKKENLPPPVKIGEFVEWKDGPILIASEGGVRKFCKSAYDHCRK